MTRRPSSLPPLTLLAALLALLTLLATACQRSEPDSPTATLDSFPTEPEPTPTTDPEPTPSPDPTTYAIPENPDDLTAEYFEHVLQALYSLESEAVRLTVDEQEIPREAMTILEAIYHPRQVDREIEDIQRGIEDDFGNTLRPPGDQLVSVYRVISADTECAFLAGLRDFTQVAVDPEDRSGEEEYFQLLVLGSAQDKEDKNPTPWVIGGSVIREQGDQPDDPCTS